MQCHKWIQYMGIHPMKDDEGTIQRIKKLLIRKMSFFSTSLSKTPSNTPNMEQFSNQDIDSFISYIETRFPSICQSLIYNDWILLIPQVFLNPTTHASLNMEFLGSHILTHVVGKSFQTLDHKCVVFIQDRIETSHGFASKMSCTVLQDDIHHDSQGRVFIYYLLQDALIPIDSTIKLQESTQTFERILRMQENGSLCITALLEGCSKFNDEAIAFENTKMLSSHVKDLISKSFTKLQELNEENLQIILVKYQLSWDAFYQLAETFVIEHVYEILFFKITSFYKDIDKQLSITISQLEYLDPHSLGLEFQHCMQLPLAVQKIKALLTLRTPIEKILLLLQTIVKLTQVGQQLTSDQIIPLLLLVIIQSKMTNIYSNWYYIKSFTFEKDVSKGELGYALSTWEAVMTFILSQKEILISSSQSCLHFFQSLSSLETFIHSKTSYPHYMSFRNPNGENVLLYASKMNLLYIFENIQESVDYNCTDYLMNTPLHIACIKGHLSLVEWLLKQENMNVNLVNSQGATPLILSIQMNHELIVEALLLHSSKGIVDVNGIDIHGNSALFYVKSLQCLKLLLSHGALINIKNHTGLSPLLYFIQQGYSKEIILHLISLDNLDFSLLDVGNRSCLHFSAYKGDVELMESLLEKFNRLDITTKRGNTPLHAAAEAGNELIIRLLLSKGSDPTIKNSQGRSPSDLCRQDSLKSLVYDYTLFLRQSFFVGEQVARVVLGNNVNNQFQFLVKSGQFPDIKSIVTVNRSLQDFIFLRNQLAMEYPEACLQELQDMVFSTKTSSSSKLIRKMVKRLNSFVLDLLSHPIFHTHELVWEFLILQEIEQSSISSRTKLKRDHLLETIHEEYTPLGSFSQALSFYKNSIVSLNQLQSVFKNVAGSCKRLGQVFKDLSMSFRILRHHLCHPTSEIQYNGSLQISEALRHMGDVCMKQSVMDAMDLGDFILDLLPTLQALIHALQRFDVLSEEHSVLSRQSNMLLDAVNRLESQAKSSSNPSEELVKRLSQTFYQYQMISGQLQAKESYMSYADSCLTREFYHFYQNHGKQLNGTLQDYVTRQIKLEKDGIQIIQEALDTLDSFECVGSDFSPTNLSFGIGSPLSHASVLELCKQEMELGSLEKV